MQDRLNTLRVAQMAHGAVLRDLIPAKHKCGPVTCSAEQWDEMEKAGDMEKNARAALIPTEQDAIDLMFDCYQRLQELGWNDAIYCPKDGSEFDAIEAGSSGIHRTHYSGEWPDGHWWIAEAGDLWPSRPMLYRVTEKELADRAAARERFRSLASVGRNAKRRDRGTGLGPKGEHAVGEAETPNSPPSDLSTDKDG